MLPLAVPREYQTPLSTKRSTRAAARPSDRFETLSAPAHTRREVAALSRMATASASASGSLAFIPNRNDSTSFDVPNAAGTLIASPTAASATPRAAPSRPRRPAAPPVPCGCRSRRCAAPRYRPPCRTGRHRRSPAPESRSRAQRGKRDLLVDALDRSPLPGVLSSDTGTRASAWRTISRTAVDIAQRIARGAQREDHLVRLRVALVVWNVHHRRDVPCSGRHSARPWPRPTISMSRAMRPSLPSASHRIRCCPSGFRSPKLALANCSLITATGGEPGWSRSSMSRPARSGICMVVKNAGPTVRIRLCGHWVARRAR